MLAQCAHVLSNGHFIIVQQHDQSGFGIAAVVQGFVAHTARQRTISHDCDHMMLFAPGISGTRHTDRSRNSRRGVTGFKAVIGAFGTLGKPGKPAIGTQRMKFVISACQQLMRIGLVAHVKNDLVLGHMKHTVKCQCDLYDPQIR